MAGKTKYNWPPLEGLILFVRKHTVQGAAKRLGIPENTLRGHLYREGVTAEDYRPGVGMNDDALRELYDLLD